MIDKGTKLNLEIARVTADGKGTAFTDDGKLVLIEGVNENDISVDVEVTKIFEETLFAVKTGGKRVDSRKSTRKDLTSSPYSMEEDDDDDDDYDDDYDDDEDED